MLHWVYPEDGDLREDDGEISGFQVGRAGEAADGVLAGACQESEGVVREERHVEAHAIPVGTDTQGPDKGTSCKHQSM